MAKKPAKKPTENKPRKKKAAMTMSPHQQAWDIYSRFYGYDPDHDLKDFQKMAGVPTTGKLDEKTVEKFDGKRCGVSDALRMTLGSQWKRRELTCGVQSFLENMTKAKQLEVYDAAWKQWSAHANIRISMVTDWQAANIVLSTGRGARADFDGPSGVLAWMMLPQGRDEQLTGRFDLDERWIDDPNLDIYLLAVACHEFGHALGLDHDAQSSGSLMAPYYKKSLSKPQANDIKRIQFLYGPPSANPPPTNPPPTGGGGGTPQPPIGVGEMFLKIIALVKAFAAKDWATVFKILMEIFADVNSGKITQEEIAQVEQAVKQAMTEQP